MYMYICIRTCIERERENEAVPDKKQQNDFAPGGFNGSLSRSSFEKGPQRRFVKGES